VLSSCRRCRSCRHAVIRARLQIHITRVSFARRSENSSTGSGGISMIGRCPVTDRRGLKRVLAASISPASAPSVEYAIGCNRVGPPIVEWTRTTAKRRPRPSVALRFAARGVRLAQGFATSNLGFHSKRCSRLQAFLSARESCPCRHPRVTVAGDDLSGCAPLRAAAAALLA